MDYIELFGIKWTPLTPEQATLIVLVLVGAVAFAMLVQMSFNPWRR